MADFGFSADRMIFSILLAWFFVCVFLDQHRLRKEIVDLGTKLFDEKLRADRLEFSLNHFREQQDAATTKLFEAVDRAQAGVDHLIEGLVEAGLATFDDDGSAEIKGDGVDAAEAKA